MYSDSVTKLKTEPKCKLELPDVRVSVKNSFSPVLILLPHNTNVQEHLRTGRQTWPVRAFS